MWGHCLGNQQVPLRQLFQPVKMGATCIPERDLLPPVPWRQEPETGPSVLCKGGFFSFTQPELRFHQKWFWLPPLQGLHPFQGKILMARHPRERGEGLELQKSQEV